VLGATPSGGAQGGGVSSGAAGVLPLTGADSRLMTTVGFVFIVGGAGVLYFTRFNDDRKADRRGRVPAPRRGRHAAGEDETRPVRRRKPSPTPLGRHFR
jgi:LPXTG-motif cell wall-anchored protein